MKTPIPMRVSFCFTAKTEDQSQEQSNVVEHANQKCSPYLKKTWTCFGVGVGGVCLFGCFSGVDHSDHCLGTQI